jgi:hypothetical protein
VRLKKRRQRWKDHMNDDPDVRGLGFRV